MEVIKHAGGENADSRLAAIVENIKRQTGEEILTTIVEKNQKSLSSKGVICEFT
jgi:hypothetical protein